MVTLSGGDRSPEQTAGYDLNEQRVFFRPHPALSLEFQLLFLYASDTPPTLENTARGHP